MKLQISQKTFCYILLRGIAENSSINLEGKFLIPIHVNVNVTIDDNRMRTNLYTNKAIKNTTKSFFCTIIDFSPTLHNGFSQKVPTT